MRLPLLRQLGGCFVFRFFGGQSGSRSMPQGKATGTCSFASGSMRQGKATGTCFCAATCFFADIIQVLLDNHAINTI